MTDEQRKEIENVYNLLQNEPTGNRTKGKRKKSKKEQAKEKERRKKYQKEQEQEEKERRKRYKKEQERVEKQRKQEEKNKEKQREKRIRERQKKREKESQFDIDNETVIGMTNSNHNDDELRREQFKYDRKQAKIARKKKRIRKFITFLIIVGLIIGGICFALISPIFNIANIQVNGNSKVNSDTIKSLSGLGKGQNIFKFRTSDVINEIKTNAYIDTVQVSRKIPDTIVINVTERTQNFNVEFLNGYAYINNQGYILEISSQKADLPVIKGVSTKDEDIVAGKRLDDEDLDKLDVVLQIMEICKNNDLDKKISSIDITNKNNYIINMDEEKKVIYLGNSENLNSKILYIPVILKENEGKEGTIYLDGDVNENFNPRFREKV